MKDRPLLLHDGTVRGIVT